ncbi:MAG: hypothetical protein U1A22_08570 [Xanthomonadaceae bacterium]|nr:hypothetical protein [Xanthomonadaceae bacterium]
MTRFDESALRALAWPDDPIPLDWLLEAEGAISFLLDNAGRDEIVIYASAGAVYIHGVLAPTAQISPADQDDLLNAYVTPEDSWCIQKAWGGGEGHRIYLDPPMSHSGAKSLAGGEKLIFRRSFHGVAESRWPLELSQKFVHSLGVYWVEERNAFCRLDNKGDIEDVIRVIWLKNDHGESSAVVVTVLIKELVTYMALAEMSLVLKFDFTRTDPKAFGGWAQEGQAMRRAPDLFYSVGRTGNASYANGCMIMRTGLTVEQLVQEWKDEDDPKARKFATFKIVDWKNDRQIEISCAPKFLSNCFEMEPTEKPFEISPAFFRPEVLMRFKSDPEKFDLTDRTISCRNAWYLRTYDINEAGQVHTYIGYLANLPYEEQLYWQSFNEWPKGPISKRAFENDFEGKFSSEYDPLCMIKYKIRQLDERPPAWWKARGDSLLDAAHYPATDSVSEWGNEILALDQVLIEGFLSKSLRQLAEGAGRPVEKQWQSIRLLQDLLEAHGRTVDDARAVVEPLATLHALRSKLKGHGAPSERTEAAKRARTEHLTLRAHFRALAAGCDHAFVAVLKSLGSTIDLG